jgi:diphthamide biosynthesis enzyme Dph1/Dph2-like protein
VFSIEEYAHEKMMTTRMAQIQRFTNVKRVGIILGILGRQGSTYILEVINVEGNQLIK